MSTFWIIEAVDVIKQGHLNLFSGLPGVSPDQFGFEGLKEGLHDGIVVAVSLARH